MSLPSVQPTTDNHRLTGFAARRLSRRRAASDAVRRDGADLVIDVPDVTEALENAEAAGGTVVKRRQAVGDMGFTGYFTDREGNVIGLWESA